MQELKQYITPDGWWTADVDISSEEWVTLLRNEDVVRPEARKWLLRFYAEKDHVSSCFLLGKKNSVSPQVINAVMTNCGRTIQKYLNRFSISDDVEDGNHYLTILMMGKSGGKSGFQLKIRPELCSAIHEYLIEALLDEFAKQVIPVGLGKEPGIDEIYKWAIVSDCQGKDDAKILQRLLGTNLIDNQFDGAAIKKLLLSEPDDLAHCFSLLKGDLAGLQGRYNSFKQATDELTGNRWKYQISDERMAGSFLACADPEHYTFYKNDAYTSLCGYLMIPAMAPRKKLYHFYELLAELLTHFENHPELVSFFEKETEGYIQSPLLNVQTIVWFMQDYMNKQLAPDTQYTWVPFVREMAEKLLSYRDKRDELLSIFYGIGDELTHAYQENGESINDITPFTVLGTLAVGKTERRTQFATYFKDKLGIKADVPTDYTGFPSLHPQRVMFIFGKNKEEHTEPFWDLFDAALNGNDISESFDEVMKVKGANRNVSMGLFWIAPKDFLSFDSTNEAYLKNYGFPPIPGKDKINYIFYKGLMDQVREKMESGEIKEKDFLEFSAAAYAFGKDTNIDDDMEPTFYDEITTALKDKKCIILQGAPGTGKTYAIPEIVARLCEEPIDLSDRQQVMEAFSRLVNEKRVVFTTFHQSMDYEDFVEGLKPFVDENKNVYYDVVDGIFKSICKDAAKPIIRNNSIDINPDAVIWKVSLGGTYDNEVRSECLKNGHIRIGWDDYGENYEEQSAYEHGGRIVLDAFYNKMTEGDIVLSCYSNKLVDAIGIVEGEPEWHDEYNGYKRLRKVRWLVKGIKEDISVIMGKSMTLSTVYRLNDISIENVLELLKKHSAAGSATSEKNTKPYVIVIDEINRGNVSKIFGELITLLEADKRTDGAMPLTARLPYSKTDLSIPSNLYLIGTMNTADRSLSQFDYAMRRRFRFITMAYNLVEMKPAPGKVFQKELFEKVTKLFISNLEEYMGDPNVRLVPADCFSLEFKPIDLWIGPSYFITSEDDPDSLLNNVFYEIIPTLEHYLEDGVFVDDAPVNAVIEELKEIALNA